MTVDIDKLKLKVQNKQTANIVLPTSNKNKFIIDNSQSAFELIAPKNAIQGCRSASFYN